MLAPVLALVYWLHLIATVLWLGGLAAVILVIWPSLAAQAGGGSQQPLLDALEARFRPLANVSLIVLIVTGLIQMGDDPHYEGFLKVGSAWTAGLFAKHLVIGLIVAVTVLIQWGILPALSRAVILSRRGDAASQEEEARLRLRARRLTMLNFGLGIIVLMCTAFITAL